MNLTAECPAAAELPATGWSSDGVQVELFLPAVNQVLSFEQQ
jgi:hypothetical protein